MNFKLCAITAVILASTTTLATAGGLAAAASEAPIAPVVAAAPVTARDWTGFYVGGQAGTGDLTLSGPVDLAEPDGETFEETADLKTFGVHAGYLADLGTFVLGGEVDYSTLDIDGDDGDNSVLRAKAIAGYDLGSLLPYATVGLASANIDGLDDNENGYFYGVGAAYQVTDSFRVGGEFLAHRFEDIFFDDSGADFDVNTFSLKASYNF